MRNNVSVGADDFGFQIYPDCDGCLIQNNVAVGSGRSGFLFGGDRRAGQESADLKIADNISGWNRQSGFAFYQPGGASALMSRNIAFGNAAGPMQIPEGYAGLTIRDLLEVDPMLVNREGMDFHLRAGSPAVGADEFAENRDRQQ